MCWAFTCFLSDLSFLLSWREPISKRTVARVPCLLASIFIQLMWSTGGRLNGRSQGLFPHPLCLQWGLHGPSSTWPAPAMALTQLDGPFSTQGLLGSPRSWILKTPCLLFPFQPRGSCSYVSWLPCLLGFQSLWIKFPLNWKTGYECCFPVWTQLIHLTQVGLSFSFSFFFPPFLFPSLPFSSAI